MKLLKRLVLYDDVFSGDFRSCLKSCEKTFYVLNKLFKKDEEERNSLKFIQVRQEIGNFFTPQTSFKIAIFWPAQLFKKLQIKNTFCESLTNQSTFGNKENYNVKLI